MRKSPTQTHKELALLYFPHLNAKSASRQLTRWIRRDEDMYNELLKAGYQGGQRVFSPMQAAILFRHLGTPSEWVNSLQPLYSK